MGISSSSLRDIIHKSEKRVSRKKKRYTRHRKKRRQNKTQKRKRTTEEILKEDYDFTDEDILFVNELRENIGAPPPGKLEEVTRGLAPPPIQTTLTLLTFGGAVQE